MATKADDLVIEIDSLLANFAPIREGLADYERLNLKDHTRDEIRASAAQYDKLIAGLEAARDAVQALADEGYPELPIREIDASAVEDLDEQIRTLTAARSRFASNTAMSMTLKDAAPVPKT